MQRSALPLRRAISITDNDKSGDVRREIPTAIVAWPVLAFDVDLKAAIAGRVGGIHALGDDALQRQLTRPRRRTPEPRPIW